MERDLHTLTELQTQLAQQEVPSELAEVAAYQRATLDHGLHSHRSALAWFDSPREQKSASRQ